VESIVGSGKGKDEGGKKHYGQEKKGIDTVRTCRYRLETVT